MIFIVRLNNNSKTNKKKMRLRVYLVAVVVTATRNHVIPKGKEAERT